MSELLTRAGSYIAIIILGYCLKRVGFFKEEDFGVLSRITLKITVPASTIVSFATMKMDASLLVLILLGLGGGLLYMGIAWLLDLRASREQRAFDILNYSGHNVGMLTMPLAQTFFGPIGVIATGLFGTGNAIVCLGGSYGVAALVKDGKGFSWKRIGKALITSVSFMCYLVMTLWNLSGIPVPGALISCAEVIKGANAFMAMLMIGVGLKITARWEQIRCILKVLVIRYGVATVLALLYYYVLPLPLEVRQMLVILAFSPLSSATPAFTAELKGDVSLSSAINSICLLCSLVIMIVLISVMLY